MASLDDLLLQADQLISSGTSTASAPVSTQSSSFALTPETPKSLIGADLLGALDTSYGKPPEPTWGDVAYAALPKWETVKETGQGLYDVAKMGVGAGYDYLTTSSEERAARKALEEQKQLQEDTKAATAAGIPVAEYRAAKSVEKRNAILDMVGRVGSEIAGGAALTGAALTAAGTAMPPVTPPTAAAKLGLLGLGGLAAYFGAGLGGVGYEKTKEVVGNTLQPGSVPKMTALEAARQFEKSGTPELLTLGAGRALQAVGKGSAKAGQRLSDALGPSTKEEAIARASGILEPQFPSAKVRGRYAGQAAREQTTGMKTTAEVLGTPEAYVAEEAIGLNPLNREAYNARLSDNVIKSQEFLIDDLAKEVAAKSPGQTADLLKQGDVADETIGRLANETLDAAKSKIQDEVSFEYAPLDLAERTSTTGVKSGVYDSLKTVYGTVPGAPTKTGVIPEELSKSIPGEISKFADEIRSKKLKSYTVEQLQRWQTRARNLIEKYGNDKDAVRSLTKIREILTSKIKSTDTGAEHWSKATESARNAWNLMENHKLAKILERDRLNFSDIYKSIIKEPENFKNYMAMVENNPEIVGAFKAKAISDLRQISVAAGSDTVGAAAARSRWIRNNDSWLKELFSPDELKRLDEAAVRGESQATRAGKTNVLGGAPTATRNVSSQTGLKRLLGQASKAVGEEATAAQKTRERLINSLYHVGGGLAGGAGLLTGNIAIPLGYFASVYGLGKISKRAATGQRLLREAAFDIAMNPKTAGWTGPKLAKALAERRAGQVEKFGKVGEKAGRITGRAGQLARIVPTEEEKQIAQQVVDNPDSYLAIDQLLQQYQPKQEGKPSTPKVVKVERKEFSSEDEAEQYLATRSPTIRAIAEAESAKDKHKSVSPKGARGRMQLMPGTAADLKVDINDPLDNVKGGEKYYNMMEKDFGKYGKEFAIAAYNWGPGSVQRAINKLKKSGTTVTWQNLVDNVFVPTETKNYVKTVIRKERQLRA